MWARLDRGAQCDAGVPMPFPARRRLNVTASRRPDPASDDFLSSGRAGPSDPLLAPPFADTGQRRTEGPARPRDDVTTRM